MTPLNFLIIVDSHNCRLNEVKLEGFNNSKDISSILIQRNSEYSSPTDFVKKVFELLDLDPALDNDDEAIIVKLLQNLELDREAVFDQISAIPSHLFFKGSEILSSHFQLDRHLDKLKERFASAVINNSIVSGLVITESGEHLFKNDILDEWETYHQYTQSEKALPDIVRGWINPILEVTHSSKQTLSIVIAEQTSNWVFEHSLRSEREKIITDLIQKLDEYRPNNIDIRVLPWDKHDDHMWVLKNETDQDYAGVLFPRPHGQQRYFGLDILGKKDVNKLVNIFEQQYFKARPIKHDAVNHVLALTIIDKCGKGKDNKVNRDDRILIGVRSKETNIQHSDIACVPTNRIPISVFSDITNSVAQISEVGSSSQLDGKWVANGNGSGHNSVAYAVKNLLSAKVGLSEAHELEELSYRSTPKVIKTAYSPVYSQDDIGEYLCMLNVLVIIDKGVDKIPERTSSYSKLEWVKVGDFLDALSNGNKEEGELHLGTNGEKIAFSCGGYACARLRFFCQR